MQQTIFHVSGSDTDTFLQGQITNDITLLTESKALFAGYCDPKGRLLSTMLLIIWQGQRYLLLPQDVAEQTIARLRMFVMRADVTFVVAENLQATFTVAADPSTSDAWSCNTSSDSISVQLPGNSKLIVGTAESIAKSTAAAGTTTPELAMIDALLPEISLATSGQCIPQTVDLDQHEGVSFNKGCYTGQEIVARLHFRGTPSRRLRRFITNAARQPQRGEHFTDSGGAAQGVVIRSAELPNGQFKVLGSVRLKSLDTSLQINSQPAELLADGGANDKPPAHQEQ